MERGMDASHLDTKRIIGKRGAHGVRGDLKGRRWLEASLAGSRCRILDAEEAPGGLIAEATKDACSRR